MSWVCNYCSSNNIDENKICEICGKRRHYKKTITLTKARADKLGMTGTVIVPNIYNAIGDGAFRSRDDITRIELPSSIRKIGKEAFWGCIGLQEVICKGKLSSIRTGAFGNCIKLASNSRPTATRHVASDAFSVSTEISEIDSLVTRMSACKIRYERIERVRQSRNDELRRVRSKKSELVTSISNLEQFRTDFLRGVASRYKIREFVTIVTAFERTAAQFENEDAATERRGRDARAAAVAAENRRKRKKRKILIGLGVGGAILLIAIAVVLIVVL